MTEELLGNTGVQWSATSIRKAEKLLSDKKVTPDESAPDVYWVEGSTRYRVQTDGHDWASCSCPNGQRTSRPSCYHLAAVLMMIRDHEPVTEATPEEVAAFREGQQSMEGITFEVFDTDDDSW